MYHGFTENKSSDKYVLNIDDFESDLRYIINNGYSFVNITEVAEYIKNGASLPEKPIMITFDDGYLNNYTLAFPLIKKYKAKVVISPIMYFSEHEDSTLFRDASYSNMNFDELTAMSNSGLVEYANHSYNMHSITNQRHGAGKSRFESIEEYRRTFLNDTLHSHQLLSKITGTPPQAYTYPFGYVSNESKSLLFCIGYKIAFSCNEKINIISSFKTGLYLLNRFNRTPQKSVKLLLADY